MGRYSNHHRLLSLYLHFTEIIGNDKISSCRSAYFLQRDSRCMITCAWGLAVMIPVYIFGPFSGGHFNPAVTIGLAVGGLFPWSMVPGYLIAQFSGAFVGAALVSILFRDQFNATEGDPNAKLGIFCTQPAVRNIPLNSLSEFVGTFVLLFSIMPGRHPRLSAPGSRDVYV